jgi:hypothetical protein
LHIKRGGIPGQHVSTEHLLILFRKILESSNHKPENRTVVYVPLSLPRPGYLDICCLLSGSVGKYTHSANIQPLPLTPPLVEFDVTPILPLSISPYPQYPWCKHQSPKILIYQQLLLRSLYQKILHPVTLPAKPLSSPRAPSPPLSSTLPSSTTAQQSSTSMPKTAPFLPDLESSAPIGSTDNQTSDITSTARLHRSTEVPTSCCWNVTADPAPK